jgi:hypothetical protein
MSIVETVLAVTTVLVCAALLARLLVGARRRAWLDANAVSAWRRFTRALRRLGGARARRREAEREAQAAIERARKAGNWEGNVYRPKSFRGPRKPH